MKEGQGELASALLNAVSRDLIAPMVLTRQLTFELDSELTARGVAGTALTSEIRAAVAEALELTAYLREIARLTSAVNLEPVQLSTVCAEAENDLRQSTLVGGCNLRCFYPRQTVVAMADYQALKSLLTGLVGGVVRRNQESKLASEVGLGYRIVRGRRVVVTIDDKNSDRVNLEKVLTASQGHAVASPIASQPLTQTLGYVVADKVAGLMGGKLAVRNRRSGGVVIELGLPLSHQLAFTGVD